MPITPLFEPFVVVDIPGKPMGKQRVRLNRKTGAVFTPERTVSYEGMVALEAQRKMKGLEILDGPVGLYIEIMLPVPQSWPKRKQERALACELLPIGKPDIDNVNKILMDAMNQVVWVDDSQVVQTQIRKFYHKMPGVTVHVFRVTVPNDPFA